jgi:aryl-alcohol dehydrogenase-like predicted oxidoreductase
METRKLGSQGPEMTTIGFGAWAIGGGGWRFGWGPQDDNESIAAIQQALDLGINWIDTAAVYGLGHAEKVVGKAVKGRRDGVLIATKCGRIWDEQGNPGSSLALDSMRREIEASLRRLDVEVIDLYQIHWPDFVTGTPLEESWGLMTRFVEEGKARYIGVSNFDAELLARCEAIRHIDSLQPPFSMVRRDIEAEVLPFCREHGIGVICYSPMQSGLLSGTFDPSRLAADDWRKHDTRFFTEPKLGQALAFVEQVRPLAQKYGKTVGQLAVAWVLAQPGVTAAIVGARSAEQVAQNLEALGWEIADDDLRTIDDAVQATLGTFTSGLSLTGAPS